MLAMWLRKLLFSLFALVTAAQLDRVVLISRHGARERLVKHHTLLVENADAGPPLTTAGVEHIRLVGAALRARYTAPSCTATKTCLAGAIGSGGFARSEIAAQSTHTDRTLGTAEVLLASLLPTSVRAGYPLPIASQLDETDYVLRGYANHKCAAQAAKISALYESSAFLAKEVETLALREEVGAALHEWSLAHPEDDATAQLSARQPPPLRDWVDVQDLLATAAAPGLALGNGTVAATARLAAWIESRKFGRAAAGSVCGGALLGEVTARLAALAGAASPRISYYSAHYPTMLCLLAALGGLTQPSPAEAGATWPDDELPGFGSVLAFEAVEGLAGRTARLLYYDGDSTWRRLPLPCTRGECALPAALLAATRATVITDATQWCEACGATTGPLAHSYGGTGSQLLQCAAAPACPVGSGPFATLGIVLLALLLVALAAALLSCVLRRRRPWAAASSRPVVTKTRIQSRSRIDVPMPPVAGATQELGVRRE